MPSPPEPIPSSPKKLRAKIISGLLVAAVIVVGGVALLKKKPAPDVVFTDITGAKVSSQSLRGKVFIVNFWATSCATCIHEMPQMVDTYNQFKDKGLEFVAIAMKDDPPNYVVNYTQTRNLPFKVVLDIRGDLADSFGNVAATPTTFVIDKSGNIIKRYVGEPQFPALHQLLEKALAAT